MTMQLMFYDDKVQNLVEQYTLTEEQLRYTKSPKESIALAKQDTSRHAVLAMDGNKLVTFFVLHEKEGVTPYSSNEQALLIRSFSTDFYGRAKAMPRQHFNYCLTLFASNSHTSMSWCLGSMCQIELLKNFISDVALSMKADRQWEFEMS